MPRPRVHDLVEANLIVAAGVRIMPVAPSDFRIGVVSDASWGNSRDTEYLERETTDT